MLKRRGLLKESAVRGCVDVKLHFLVKTLKTSKTLEIPNKSVHSNDFWTVRDERKIPTDRLYENGVGESNGDVISAAGRLIAAQTISGSF
jgi:hypothetical protein